VRRLRHGVLLGYGYAVYNAWLDRATGRPRPNTQVRPFLEGELAFGCAPTPLDAEGQKEMKRLAAGGRLRVGTELEPGDYVLRVVVTGGPAGGKSRGTATRRVDFEVVAGRRG
jgi:hypothetical protein